MQKKAAVAILISDKIDLKIKGKYMSHSSYSNITGLLNLLL